LVFAQIAFLVGTVAVVGPLLAHLFARPRFRRVPFAMLRFLQVGEMESQSRRRLQNFLILFLRCTIILLIVLLFAQPSLLAGHEEGQAREIHFLALDNSLSMAYGGADGHMRALRDAVSKYIDDAGEGAVFNVYPLASRTHAKGLDKAQVLAYLEGTAPGESLAVSGGPVEWRPFLSALGDAKREAAFGARVSALVVSDFTPAVLAGLETVETPVLVDAFRSEVVRPDGPARNLAVIDAALAATDGGMKSAGRPFRVTARVANYGMERQQATLVGTVGESDVASSPVTLAPDERTAVALDLPSGSVSEPHVALTLILRGADDPLPEDDAFRLALGFPGGNGRDVLILASSSREAFLVKTALDTYAAMSSLEALSVRQVLHGDLDATHLQTADYLVFVSLPAALGDLMEDLLTFTRQGGTVIYFMQRGQNSHLFADLAQAGLAPATPGDLLSQPVSIGAHSGAGGDMLDPDGSLVRVLRGYGVRQLPFSACFDCEPAPGGECIWPFEKDAGFIYYKRVGNGATVLVNTSADDSMGPLLKSPAAVAFCRYLLGPGGEVQEYAFRCGETVTLPATALELAEAGRAGDRPVAWVETPTAGETRATIADPFIVVEAPAWPGWVRTLAQPIRHAGVNAIEGETDMQPPPGEAVVQAMARVFTTDKLGRDYVVPEDSDAADAGVYRPIWKWIAWAALASMLLEAFVANVVKR